MEEKRCDLGGVHVDLNSSGSGFGADHGLVGSTAGMPLYWPDATHFEHELWFYAAGRHKPARFVRG